MLISQLKTSYTVILVTLISFVLVLDVVNYLFGLKDTLDFILLTLGASIIVLFIQLKSTYRVEFGEESVKKEFRILFFKRKELYRLGDLRFVYSVFPTWIPYKVFILSFSENKTITVGSMITNTHEILSLVQTIRGMEIFDNEMKAILEKRQKVLP